ncbi:SDR family oxidoreductase [Streptosporangium sp. NPDC020145]|uniref:SDR family oxidoreductase n=1 Tax=Streptosporangium sp. NPDC020145 TaxID=3154694 RepID=UPI0034393A14
MNVPELLTGKVVLVAGVGPGLGRELAVRCARAGADLVLAARTASRLEVVADEVKQLGRRALVVPADLTDEAETESLVLAALETYGRVDTLIHNAFAAPRHLTMVEVGLDEVREGFEINVYAALRLVRLLAPTLVENRGSVVMVNSSVLRHSIERCGSYKMAKAGLLALAQMLSTELGPQGVRVNSVAPGPILIDTVKAFVEEIATARGVPPTTVYDEMTSSIDRRRLQEPEEVADAVIFLASDMARAITGHCLDVNGGEYHS